ncbi:MAG: hypothetical protein IKQ46_01320 [Bacteroidales bacterium]|nr:hypothetical protein [Bacteroidales bacterium]
MKRIEFITDNEEPITSYEKAKFEIVDFKSVYIICGSTTPPEFDGDDDDWDTGDDDDGIWDESGI